MIQRWLLGLLLFGLALPLLADEEPPANPFPVGEHLVYEVSVWKGAQAIGTRVGAVSFRTEAVTYRGRSCYRFEAVAKGGGFGYTVSSQIRAYIDRESLKPLRFTFDQRGSEVRSHKMLFYRNQARYLKYGHCGQGGCKNRRHAVDVRDGAETLDSSRRTFKHCYLGHDCDNEAHMIWMTRDVHRLKAPAYDLLSAVYLARTLDFEAKEEVELTVINKHDQWDVGIAVLDTETVTVPAGRFDCYRVALKPDNKNPDEPDSKFEGLFGIKGAIRVWVDKKTLRPVKVTGVIPFGVDLNAEVVLTRATTGSESPADGESTDR